MRNSMIKAPQKNAHAGRILWPNAQNKKKKPELTLQLETAQPFSHRRRRDEQDLNIKCLVHYFSAISNKAIEIDVLKRSLTRKSDFDSFRYFKYLSSYQNDLTLNELQSLVRAYSFKLSEQELTEIFSSIKSINTQDRSQICWAYSDFLRFLYSSQEQLSQFLNIKHGKQQQHNGDKSIPQTARQPLRKKVNFEKLDLAFIMILIKEREINVQIEEMKNDKNLQLIDKIDAYTEITNSDFIIANDLIKFMQKYSSQLGKNGSECLLKRMDVNKDGKVNYLDFQAFISSNEPDQRCPTLSTKEDQDPQQCYEDYLLQESIPTVSAFQSTGRNQDYLAFSRSDFKASQIVQLNTPNNRLRPTLNTPPPNVLVPREILSINHKKCTPLKLSMLQPKSKTSMNMASSIKHSSRNTFQLTKYLNPKHLMSQNNNMNQEREYSQTPTNFGFAKTQLISCNNLPFELAEETKKQIKAKEQNNPESDAEVEEEQCDAKVDEVKHQNVRISSLRQSKMENESIQDNFFEVLNDRPSNEKSLDNNSSAFFKSQIVPLSMQEFIRYLKQIIESDKDLDAYRINMLSHEQFDLIEAFKVFDLTQSGLISAQMLKQALKQMLQLVVTDRELVLLMNRYDRDNDGLLRFSDFCELLAPKNPPKHIQQMIKQKFMSLPKHSGLSQKELDALKSTIERAIQIEMELEMLRFRLASIEAETNGDLPLDAIFKQLSMKHKISKQKLGDLLIEYANYFSTERELSQVFSRFDKKHQNQITYDDFLDEMTPRTYYNL